ncbi:Mitochondrial import receptor subunit TOM40, partial [Orchesella cincta]
VRSKANKLHEEYGWSKANFTRDSSKVSISCGACTLPKSSFPFATNKEDFSLAKVPCNIEEYSQLECVMLLWQNHPQNGIILIPNFPPLLKMGGVDSKFVAPVWTGPYFKSSQVDSPGTYDNLARKCRELFPEQFEGLTLRLAKSFANDHKESLTLNLFSGGDSLSLNPETKLFPEQFEGLQLKLAKSFAKDQKNQLRRHHVFR